MSGFRGRGGGTSQRGGRGGRGGASASRGGRSRGGRGGSSGARGGRGGAKKEKPPAVMHTTSTGENIPITGTNYAPLKNRRQFGSGSSGSSQAPPPPPSYGPPSGSALDYNPRKRGFDGGDSAGPSPKRKPSMNNGPMSRRPSASSDRGGFSERGGGRGGARGGRGGGGGRGGRGGSMGGTSSRGGARGGRGGRGGGASGRDLPPRQPSGRPALPPQEAIVSTRGGKSSRPPKSLHREKFAGMKGSLAELNPDREPPVPRVLKFSDTLSRAVYIFNLGTDVTEDTIREWIAQSETSKKKKTDLAHATSTLISDIFTKSQSPATKDQNLKASEKQNKQSNEDHHDEEMEDVGEIQSTGKPDNEETENQDEEGGSDQSDDSDNEDDSESGEKQKSTEDLTEDQKAARKAARKERKKLRKQSASHVQSKLTQKSQNLLNSITNVIFDIQKSNGKPRGNAYIEFKTPISAVLFRVVIEKINVTNKKEGNDTKYITKFAKVSKSPFALVKAPTLEKIEVVEEDAKTDGKNKVPGTVPAPALGLNQQPNGGVPPQQQPLPHPGQYLPPPHQQIPMGIRQGPTPPGSVPPGAPIANGRGVPTLGSHAQGPPMQAPTNSMKGPQRMGPVQGQPRPFPSAQHAPSASPIMSVPGSAHSAGSASNSKQQGPPQRGAPVGPGIPVQQSPIGSGHATPSQPPPPFGTPQQARPGSGPQSTQPVARQFQAPAALSRRGAPAPAPPSQQRPMQGSPPGSYRGPGSPPSNTRPGYAPTPAAGGQQPWQRGPQQGAPPGYPPPQGQHQAPPQGYPQQGQNSGWRGPPPQGYPQQGYLPQGSRQAAPPQGYAPRPGPPQQGYPPKQGYPPQQGYAPQQAYPPQPQQGRPPPQGYPPQQQGRPPPPHGYPPQQGPPRGAAPQNYGRR